jgi:hypothetical protein
MASEPRFRQSPYNAELLTGYLQRNGIYILNAETLKAAFERLYEAELFEEQRPKVQPVAEPAPAPVESEDLENLPPGNYTPRPGWVKVRDSEQWGTDQTNGVWGTFSGFEIDRMDSETYRKTFALHTAGGNLDFVSLK